MGSSHPLLDFAREDQDFSHIDASHVIQSLQQALPTTTILSTKEQLKPYECDGFTLETQVPLAVVMPTTEAEVATTLKTCSQLGVPVVARGAGTGLSGGAIPHPHGVILSLAKMNQILKIDQAARVAIVQPGIRNLAVSEATAPYGLYYAPDPSSQIACTIGGNIAENAGGVHCLKYGLTVHNVLRIRAVTIDGDIIEVGSHALDVPGYDLLSLIIGSEGMLAVATEITLKLTPTPQFAQCVLASFDDVVKASDAVAAIIAAGIIPAGLEMMDQPATIAAEAFVNAGYPLDAKAMLICESDGTPEEVAEEIEHIERVLRQAGATELRVSQSEQERALFWAGRKSAFPAAGRISPDYLCMDGTIPRKRLGEMLTAIQDMEEKYGLRCLNVFHAGDGNLHPLVLYDGSQAEQREKAKQFGGEILELSVALGGTITGEHGVGLEKIDQMCVQFNELERHLFFAIKHAFDPAGLLNPGKAIPTLNRCAEFGHMHVHQGQLPFADIPRF